MFSLWVELSHKAMHFQFCEIVVLLLPVDTCLPINWHLYHEGSRTELILGTV